MGKAKALLGMVALAITLLALGGAAIFPAGSIEQYGLLAIAVLITAWNTVYTVDQEHVAVLTFFGRFAGIGRAGINFKLPFFINIYDPGFSVQVLSLPLKVVEGYTQNNVPVKVEVAVMCYVMESAKDVRLAYFRLANPNAQVAEYLESALRSRITSRTLDELNAERETLAQDVLDEVGPKMSAFGYTIQATLIKNIVPDEKVQAAMTAVARAEYDQKAAAAEGEADRIRAQKLGEGTGDQRAAVFERIAQKLGDMESFKALSDEERGRIYDLIELSIIAEMNVQIAGQASEGTKVMYIPLPSGTNIDVRQLVTEAIEGAKHSKAG